jgi:hypothetical protein
MKVARTFLGCAAIGLLLAGCVMYVSPDLVSIPPNYPALRQMQSRRFDTTDQQKILAGCITVLQDLGFIIVDSNAKLGLIVASEGQYTFTPGGLSFLGGQAPTVDSHIRLSVIARPAEDGKAIIVRITMQRKTGNDRLSNSTEEINNPADFQEFYRRLSEAVSLEAASL